MNNKKNLNVHDFKNQGSNTKSYNEVCSDAEPENYNSCGEIKFRQNKRRRKIKNFLKGVTFIVIASISGAASGVYIVNKRFSELVTSSNYPINKVVLPQYSNDPESDLPLAYSTRIAAVVGPSIVGISNSADNFKNNILNDSTGSGVIFDAKGYIVTNYHIVQDVNNILVKLSTPGSKPINAQLIGFDKPSDLAVIKIDIKTSLPVVKFADSSKVRVGDETFAIGNALGEEVVAGLTPGVVSGINRRISLANASSGEKSMYSIFETTSAVNQDNSGGPLCNIAGEVIGITSSRLSIIESIDNMSFAITSNQAYDVIKAIMLNEKVKGIYLGIDGKPTAGTSSTNKGILIHSLDSSSCVSEAGIRATDIIVEFDGKSIATMDEITQIVDKHKIGDIVGCKVLRDGKYKDFKITLKTK